MAQLRLVTVISEEQAMIEEIKRILSEFIDSLPENERMVIAYIILKN